MLLEGKGLAKRYGQLAALSDANIAIEKGTIHGLIGPNGSGKSTLLQLMSGAGMATSGRLELNGHDITGWSAARRARAGVAIKFQVPRIYVELSVADNLALARRGHRGVAGLLRQGDEQVDSALIQSLHLDRHLDRRAGELSHGEQQWLEIAMALAPNPSLLLLDEPTAGMSSEERRMTGDLLRSLRASVTIVIVDHDLELIRGLCDRVSVLDQGVMVATGTPADLENDQLVKEAYLGRA